MRSYYLRATELLFQVMRNLETDGGDGRHNTVNIIKATKLYTSKWLKWHILCYIYIYIYIYIYLTKIKSNGGWLTGRTSAKWF